MSRLFTSHMYSADGTRRSQLYISELNGTRLRGIQWSEQEKRMLAVIRRFFETKGANVPIIMCKHFKCAPNRFSSGQCASRFSSMLKDKDTVWQEVYLSNGFHEPSQPISSLITAVEHIVRSFGLPVKRRHQEESPRTNTNPRSRHRVSRPVSRVSRLSNVGLRRFAFNQSDDSMDSDSSDFLPISTMGRQEEVIEITDDESDEIDLTSHHFQAGHQPETEISTVEVDGHSLATFRALSEALPDTPCPPSHLPAPEHPVTPPARCQASEHSVTPQDCQTLTATASPKARVENVPAILFRTYTTDNAGINDANHFRAGFFNRDTDPIPDPPLPSEDFFVQSVGKHLRRDFFQSPFISLSPSPVWVLHKAMHNSDTRASDLIYLAVVNGLMIEKGRVWHARPLLRRIKDLQNDQEVPFWPQEHKRYKGSSEWLVYGEINSIMSTITLDSIEQLAASIEPIGAILRLDTIKTSEKTADVYKAFSEMRLQLSYANFIGLAKVLLLLGVSPNLHPHIIESGVYEIVKGWHVYVSDPALIEETYGLWVYYFFAREPEAAEFDVVDARNAFMRGIETAQEVLHNPSKHYVVSRVLAKRIRENPFVDVVIDEVVVLDDDMAATAIAVDGDNEGQMQINGPGGTADIEADANFHSSLL